MAPERWETGLVAVMAVILGLIALFAWYLPSLFFAAAVTVVLWEHYYKLEDMQEEVSELEWRLAELKGRPSP